MFYLSQTLSSGMHRVCRKLKSLENFMKNLFVVLAFLVFGGAHAESRLKIEGGELLSSAINWSATGVKVSPEAQKYPEAMEQAFRNPGKVVSVHEEKSVTVVDLFHFRRDTVMTLDVKYDVQKSSIDVSTGKEVVGTEIKFLFFPFFWLVAMISALLLFSLKKENGAIVFFFAGVSIVGSAFSVPDPLFAVFVLGALCFAAMVAPSEKSGKPKKPFVVLFFGMMLLTAGLVYYPLF